MATLADVVNSKNETVDRCELPDAIFGAPVKPHLLHDVVRMQLANRRQGTAETRASEVAAGSLEARDGPGSGWLTRSRSGGTAVWCSGRTRSYAYDAQGGVAAGSWRPHDQGAGRGGPTESSAWSGHTKAMVAC
jgi:hypothetical protein